MDGTVSLESGRYAPIDGEGITFLLLSIDRSSHRPSLPLLFLGPIDLACFEAFLWSNGPSLLPLVAQLPPIGSEPIFQRFFTSVDCSISAKSGDRSETGRARNSECEKWSA